MAYIGVNNVAKKVIEVYVGDANGIARKVSQGFVGDANGIARLWWDGDYGEPILNRSLFTERLQGETPVPTTEVHFSLVAPAAGSGYKRFTTGDVDQSGSIELYINENSYYVSGASKMWFVSHREKFYLPEDCARLFKNWSNLTTVTGLQYIQAKEGFEVDLSDCFNGCSALTNVEFGAMDSSNVVNVENMFMNCSDLESCPGIALFMNQLQTTSLKNFFYGAGFNSIDLRGVDFSKFTDFSGMFQRCYLNATQDFSYMNCANAIYMDYMFANAINIKQITLPSGGENCISIRGLLANLSYLTYVDASHLNPRKAENVAEVFYQDYKLTTIDGLERWEIGAECETVSAFGMFAATAVLINLNMCKTNWNNIADTSGMFNFDCGLSFKDTQRTIRVSADFAGVDLIALVNSRHNKGFEYQSTAFGDVNPVFIYCDIADAHSH